MGGTAFPRRGDSVCAGRLRATTASVHRRVPSRLHTITPPIAERRRQYRRQMLLRSLARGRTHRSYKAAARADMLCPMLLDDTFPQVHCIDDTRNSPYNAEQHKQ